MEVLNSKQDYQSSIKVGPWGGVGGAPWNYMANGGIVEITINHEGIINSLSFKSVCANKEEKCSRNFGLKRGKTTKLLQFKYNLWPQRKLHFELEMRFS
ncbi:hypothetical protein LWI29_022383 [Acer saccharum]|uniref:Jacalin-type lectin domain-containing protein n=1 Tax=Acer saccharum TaxID=4024 RepID=A0AA39VZQ3_ACESA|nr:hypothetical protein LWI29_022383 [Acer saccharum]